MFRLMYVGANNAFWHIRTPFFAFCKPSNPTLSNPTKHIHLPAMFSDYLLFYPVVHTSM